MRVAEASSNFKSTLWPLMQIWTKLWHGIGNKSALEENSKIRYTALGWALCQECIYPSCAADGLYTSWSWWTPSRNSSYPVSSGRGRWPILVTVTGDSGGYTGGNWLGTSAGALGGGLTIHNGWWWPKSYRIKGGSVRGTVYGRRGGNSVGSVGLVLWGRSPCASGRKLSRMNASGG